MLHGINQGQFIQTLDIVTESVIARGFQAPPCFTRPSKWFLIKSDQLSFFICEDASTQGPAVCVQTGGKICLTQTDRTFLLQYYVCVLWGS